MKTSVFIMFRLCSLLALGLTTVGYSADEDSGEKKKRGFPEHQPREQGAKPRLQDSVGKKGRYFKSFQAVDVDKDGELTFEEFSKMGRLTQMDERKRKKLFGFLDGNKDGKLHMSELKPREPGWMVELRKDFTLIDIDNNGSLDLGEFSKVSAFSDKPKGLVSRFFAKMDRNNDQVIERSELKWPSRSKKRHAIDFAKYDINASGGLDFEEYSKLPLMDKCSEARRKQLFERIDADKNSEISMEEVKTAHRAHRPFSPHGKPSRDRGPMRGGKEADRRPRRHGNEESKKDDIDSSAEPK